MFAQIFLERMLRFLVPQPAVASDPSHAMIALQIADTPLGGQHATFHRRTRTSLIATPRHGIIAAIMFAACVAAAPASVRAAAFGPAFQLSGDNACGPQVAIDTGGNAVFSWEQFSIGTSGLAHVQARRRSAAGALGPIVSLSGRSSVALFDHRLAIAAGGDAIVAWMFFPQNTSHLHTQFRAFSAAGVLGPIELLSNVIPTDGARVAMNASGAAMFAWRHLNASRSAGFIEARSRSAAGVLGPIQSLSPAIQSATVPEVAINANGEAAFAWERSFRSGFQLELRRRSAAGALGLIHQNLGAAAQNNLFEPNLGIGIDRLGNAIVTWTDPSTARSRVKMRTLSAGDVVGLTQPVSQGSGFIDGVSPQFAMNAAGDAAFTFLEFDGTDSLPKARVRSAAGGFGPSQTLSQNPSLLVGSAAIDAHGRAMFVFDNESDPSMSTHKIKARARAAHGALGATQTLSSNALLMGPASARVAMNARGDAAAVWCQADDADRFAVFGAVAPR